MIQAQLVAFQEEKLREAKKQDAFILQLKEGLKMNDMNDEVTKNKLQLCFE